MPIRVLGKSPDRVQREWNSPQKRKERQQQYMDKHGTPGPRRKRLTPADTTKRERDKKIENLHERMGGGTKAKPHSSREGRVASGKRTLDRYRKKAQAVMKPNVAKKRKPYGVRILKAIGGKAGTGPSPGTRIKARKARAAEWWTGREGKHAVYNPILDKKLREKRPHSSPEGRMRDVKTAYAKAAEEHKQKRRTWKKNNVAGRPAAGTKKFTPRTSKAIGGGVRKVGKRFLDFIRTGKHVDKKGVKTNVPKAAERLTGKPHVDHGKRKRIKHLGKGKAEGGRIGLKKGSVHTPGSHSWWLLQQSKPKRTKKAEGGRVNFRHGGSVGAAIRGHGAEIK